MVTMTYRNNAAKVKCNLCSIHSLILFIICIFIVNNVFAESESEVVEKVQDIFPEIPLAANSTDTIFSDSFSGSYPGPWSIGHDGGEGNYSWAWTTGTGYAHCYSNTFGSNYYYPDNLHVYMERRGVSLQGYGSASLSFNYIVDCELSYDYLTVHVRDQNGNWHELWRESGITEPLTWSYKTIDLKAFAGQTGLYIQFRFDSDSSESGNPYSGAYIGNVSLTAITSNTCPTLSITSPSNNITVPQGQFVEIDWNGTDPDDIASVTIGYDEDGIYDNGNHTWIALARGEDGSYNWDTEDVPAGVYYIFGIIYDGECDSFDYASGSVTITDLKPEIRIEPLTLDYQEAESLQGAMEAGKQIDDPRAIMLKNRQFVPNLYENSVSANLSGHVIVQFEEYPDEQILEELKACQVKILHWIPKNAAMVSLPADSKINQVRGIRWIGKLRPSDKISRLLNRSLKKGFSLVDFYPDVNEIRAASTILSMGGRIVKNPYLLKNTYLVEMDEDIAINLSENEDVAWIWPASDALINGEPVHVCPGALTEVGVAPNYVTNGEGWDGAGKGSISLTYHFVNGTNDISGSQEEPEVERGLFEWSKYASISWAETSTAGRSKSIDIAWGTGDHCIGTDFDGPGGVLAHCFYPTPINTESIAGDMHFDDAEMWRIGSNYDVFSIALHEAGHGLGLDHSSDTDAVMYQYYKMVTGLHQDDIDGIQSIYASNDGFMIYNEGDASLTVTSISEEKGSSWLSYSPSTPFTIPAGSSRFVTVNIDSSGLSDGNYNDRLLVYSNDSNESPYPGGVNINLTVTGTRPEIILDPSDDIECEGEDAVFSVTAVGTSPLIYQWTKDGSSVGTNNEKLTLTNVQASDDGAEIVCKVTNDYGFEISSSAYLTVNTAPGFVNITPPTSTICAGLPFTLCATTDGSSPLTYKWLVDNVLVDTTTSSCGTFTLGSTGTYQVKVEVCNSCGCVSSPGIFLEVCDKLTITQQPSNISVSDGGSASFSITATGCGPLHYQWKQNSANVGSDTPGLTLSPVQCFDNDSQITCDVTNGCGTTTSIAAVLTVTGCDPCDISISKDPASKTVNEGDNATFNVLASGSGTLHYQWTKNGSNIGSDQPSLTLTNVDRSDNGASIACEVSNINGSPPSKE